VAGISIFDSGFFGFSANFTFGYTNFMPKNPVAGFGYFYFSANKSIFDSANLTFFENFAVTHAKFAYRITSAKIGYF